MSSDPDDPPAAPDTGLAGLQAILFDLDGTLVDSLHDIATSMNTVLARWGFPVHPIPDYKIMVGNGIVILCRRALGPARAADEKLLADVLADMRAEYSQHILDRTRPYDGIVDLLDQLTARGLLLGVLSNKPHAATVEMVEHIFGARRFAAVVGQRPDMPPKPDPTAGRLLLETIGAPAQGAALVGDTSIDMRTAAATGMTAVGCTWGFRGEKELREAGARYILHHPGDLLRLL